MSLLTYNGVIDLPWVHVYIRHPWNPQSIILCFQFFSKLYTHLLSSFPLTSTGNLTDLPSDSSEPISAVCLASTRKLDVGLTKSRGPSKLIVLDAWLDVERTSHLRRNWPNCPLIHHQESQSANRPNHRPSGAPARVYNSTDLPTRDERSNISRSIPRPQCCYGSVFISD
jgi:hypothetical protein